MSGHPSSYPILETMTRSIPTSLAGASVPAALALLLVALGCGGDDPAAGASGASDEAKKPLVALREAPPFALETLEGDSLTLADLSEKKAILMNFWGSWCAPCRAEMPELIELHEAYEEKGFMVLGVTVNDLPRDSREFAEEMEIPYPSVIGTPAMLEDYRLSPWLPTTLLVRDGEIVREWVGPRTREEFEYPIRVALGLAPDLMDVVQPRGAAREEGPPAGAEPLPGAAAGTDEAPAGEPGSDGAPDGAPDGDAGGTDGS